MAAPSATIGAMDCWTVTSVPRTSRSSVLAPIDADAGVVVRLGVERPGAGREQQGRDQEWSEHRWKMDVAPERGSTRRARA